MAEPQAFIRVVPRGGRRTASQIGDQLKYFSRKGKAELKRSERYQGITVSVGEIDELSQSWAEETGNYPSGLADRERAQDLTCHIVVSFEPGTDDEKAHNAGRSWADEMFGKEHGAGRFDYITAFHSNRPHPHLHIVVNRRAYDGTHWLKISKRDPLFNYDNMRTALVEVAARHGISLAATSRAERGISNAPLTTGGYRRVQRDAVSIEPPEELDFLDLRQSYDQIRNFIEAGMQAAALSAQPKRDRRREPVAPLATDVKMNDAVPQSGGSGSGPDVSLDEQIPRKRKRDVDDDGANAAVSGTQVGTPPTQSNKGSFSSRNDLAAQTSSVSLKRQRISQPPGPSSPAERDQLNGSLLRIPLSRNVPLSEMGSTRSLNHRGQDAAFSLSQLQQLEENANGLQEAAPSLSEKKLGKRKREEAGSSLVASIAAKGQSGSGDTPPVTEAGLPSRDRDTSPPVDASTSETRAIKRTRHGLDANGTERANDIEMGGSIGSRRRGKRKSNDRDPL